MLKDSNPQIRLAAVSTLGSIGGNQAVEIFINGLKDKDLEFRLTVINILGVMRNPTAVPGLLKILDEDTRLEVRNTTIKALGEIGDRKALPALNQLVSRGGKEIQPVAREAIIKIVEKNAAEKK
ncbi:MAG TPA: hypothetical protein DHV62_05540 [Elusimicrobia bacterium]|nr:hypothetical protein [Elusimicrobiota bacterium]